jgi:hypothetical protein
MADIKTFVQLALSFEGVVEAAHFEKRSFRINKRIFATLDEKNLRAVLPLSPVDQAVFCAFDHTIIFPVNGTWGRQGWTVVELSKIRKAMLRHALTRAYCQVAPKLLSAPYNLK